MIKKTIPYWKRLNLALIALVCLIILSCQLPQKGTKRAVIDKRKYRSGFHFRGFRNLSSPNKVQHAFKKTSPNVIPIKETPNRFDFTPKKETLNLLASRTEHHFTIPVKASLNTSKQQALPSLNKFQPNRISDYIVSKKDSTEEQKISEEELKEKIKKHGKTKLRLALAGVSVLIVSFYVTSFLGTLLSTPILLSIFFLGLGLLLAALLVSFSQKKLRKLLHQWYPSEKNSTNQLNDDTANNQKTAPHPPKEISAEQRKWNKIFLIIISVLFALFFLGLFSLILITLLGVSYLSSLTLLGVLVILGITLVILLPFILIGVLLIKIFDR